MIVLKKNSFLHFSGVLYAADNSMILTILRFCNTVCVHVCACALCVFLVPNLFVSLVYICPPGTNLLNHQCMLLFFICYAVILSHSQMHYCCLCHTENVLIIVTPKFISVVQPSLLNFKLICIIAYLSK